MIPGILLATRQTFYTILLIVLFLIIKFQNINNIYGLHFLLKLSYIYSFTPWLPDKHFGELGAQNDLFAVVGYLKMARTKNPPFSLRVWYISSSHPCGGKLSYNCCITLRLKSQQKSHIHMLDMRLNLPRVEKWMFKVPDNEHLHLLHNCLIPLTKWIWSARSLQ
jgi:hypothetical protein